MTDYFLEFRKVEYTKKRDGVYIKSLTGNNAQLLLIKLEPGIETKHAHPQEQMGYILSGSVELTIGGQVKTCEPGDAYLIPANELHCFKVMGSTPLEYLEIFSPPKEENVI